ncbi:MAG: twin-arginine translocase subunit TatB [Synechococcaceae cyanobacterium SM1_2_3]|nr:twin-arginine translocase subunit TatB [Synechococcaceae cyanobacterium SM1_2_3]
MFDISFWELAMIGVVALIVVGPERLPGLARTTGRWLGKARRMVAEVKAEVDRELQLDELKQSLRQQADLNSLKDVMQPIQALRDDIQAQFNDLDPGRRRAGIPECQPRRRTTTRNPPRPTCRRRAHTRAVAKSGC